MSATNGREERRSAGGDGTVAVLAMPAAVHIMRMRGWKCMCGPRDVAWLQPCGALLAGSFEQRRDGQQALVQGKQRSGECTGA